MSNDEFTDAPDNLTEEATTEEAATEEAATGEGPDTKGRKPASDLEGDLKAVLDGIVTGQIDLAGKQPTPHILAVRIQERRGGDREARPSSGAVAAALARWAKIGYIEVSEGPTAFVDYTDAGRSEGLSALKAKHRASLKAARADASAPAADQEPAPGPSGEPEMAPSTHAFGSSPF